jgi:hypothetical protein
MKPSVLSHETDASKNQFLNGIDSVESTSEVLKKFHSRLFFQNKDFCSFMNMKLTV